MFRLIHTFHPSLWSSLTADARRHLPYLFLGRPGQGKTACPSGKKTNSMIAFMMSYPDLNRFNVEMFFIAKRCTVLSGSA
jgi:hypothetical protein